MSSSLDIENSYPIVILLMMQPIHTYMQSTIIFQDQPY